MSIHYQGKVIIPAQQLNLDLTLLGGQSFRWEKLNSINNAPQWHGVAYDAYWVLAQNETCVTYDVYPASACVDIKHDSDYFNKLLHRYFRLDFDLPQHAAEWKASHEHFARIATDMKAVRLLDQEPLENILSFICSQNNHIKRITTMIQWLCGKYGTKIGDFNGRAEYTFPTLDSMQDKELETNLCAAKFGYRAKFIAQTVAKIAETGGTTWLQKLRTLPYKEARLELVTLPGIGFKVADCICLMSLNHLESVPIDTHIFKIAQSAYLPHLAKVKTVTPKIYDEISTHFRNVYGPFAGWTQAVLFCSELQQFQTKPTAAVKTSQTVAKKKKK